MSRTQVRRTKIVATLGPAWDQPAQMTALIDAGVDVVRINASHGTAEIRNRWIEQLRTVTDGRRDSVALLLDLQGPRIRVGTLAEPLRLESGERVVFAPEEEASPGEIPTTYDALANDVRVGARILLDDGLLNAEVIQVMDRRVVAMVHYGGLVKSHKGMNLPGIEVSAPALTEKDLEDVAQAVAVGVDYVALSFVRRPEDMEQLRTLVPRSTRLIAKIEKDTALKNLCGILDASDAIMVARGDLGVELPFEEVPLMQKQIIREAGLHGKPVITATQMLESMVQAPRPTRAEASDVANAILDGTDAVMLSAETAVGTYPLEAVCAMDRIAREMELQRQGRGVTIDAALGRRASEGVPLPQHRQGQSGPVRTEDAIAVAVCAAAEMLSAPLIVCFTSSGFTARKVATCRPTVPIFASTPEPETFRQLALVWGVTPALIQHSTDYEVMLGIARQQILERGLAQPGERLVVTAGVPFDMPGTTNLLKIEAV
ncbi:MAG TPA: pyruvate kinase [Gemmatimonadales bacterium]|jgi:pyruvate kinase|nr:pyruvate kinase [Gemmatimonadales bacterium]